MRVSFKVLWAACGLCSHPSATFAQDLSAVVTGMRACAAERDDARRLACYDQQFRHGGLTSAGPESGGREQRSAPSHPAPSPAEASGSSGRSGSATAPVGSTPGAGSSPALALTPEQRFGLNPQLERKEQGVAGQPVQLDRLTARVTAVSHKLRGEAVITLENGQIWEQADPDTHLVVKAGDSISIRRGTLGSFWLSGSAPASRLRRVK